MDIADKEVVFVIRVCGMLLLQRLDGFANTVHAFESAPFPGFVTPRPTRPVLGFLDFFTGQALRSRLSHSRIHFPAQPPECFNISKLIAVFIHGSLENKGFLAELRVIEQRAKPFFSDVALTDMLVPVDA